MIASFLVLAAALASAPPNPAEDMASALPVTALAGADGSCAALWIDATFDIAGLRATANSWPSKDIAVRVEAGDGAPEGCVEAVAIEVDAAGFRAVYLPDGTLWQGGLAARDTSGAVDKQ